MSNTVLWELFESSLPVRSKTAGMGKRKGCAQQLSRFRLDEIRNSRREIMVSFRCYDNPLAFALSIKSPAAGWDQESGVLLRQDSGS